MKQPAFKKLFFSCLVLSMALYAVPSYPMGSIQYPDTADSGQRRETIARSVVDGLLDMRSPKTRLIPSHWGQPGFERLGFLYDNSVAAMVLSSAGHRQEAEDILDYFVAKLRVPKSWIEANEDCNNLFGVIKLIRADHDRTLKTVINTVDIDQENLMGKGIAEYDSTPGPAAFFLFALLKVNPQKYINDAVAIGNVLLYYQNDDGGVVDGERDPDRVYTEPHMDALAAFQMLFDLTKDRKWKTAADSAWNWFEKNVYEPGSGSIYQGVLKKGVPNKAFAEDCYSFSMAGPAGDGFSVDEIKKITLQWLDKCLTCITVKLPDSSLKTLLLVDFADASADETMDLRGGYHPMGSPEWTGGAILALQKNSVRMWNAGDGDTARFYKSIAEILTEQVFNSYYLVPGLKGMISFYSTGQHIDVGPFRNVSENERQGWLTPVYYVANENGPDTVQGGSSVGSWPLLAYYGVNPFVLNDEYADTYRKIDIPEEIKTRAVRFLQKSVLYKSYRENGIKENPWPDVQIVEPNQFNRKMWETLKLADGYRDKNDRKNAVACYEKTIDWSYNVLRDQKIVDLAKKENQLKKDEMGGILWYPWGKTYANNEGELLNQILRYPLLNEVAVSIYGIITASYELGRRDEVTRYMEMLIDDYSLHQIPAVDEENAETKGLISGFWNALQSWEDSPQYKDREGALGKIYWEILRKRELKTAKPDVVFFEDSKRYQSMHFKVAFNTFNR